MNPSRSLLVLLICLGAQHSALANQTALWDFGNIILCIMPDSSHLMDYMDYGCYCGLGGSGTPVDELDRCCQVHDNCYGAAMRYPDCLPIIDNPYTKYYKYRCDEASRAVTCLDDNSPCARFICECDRRAAMCFAKAPYIPAHAHLPKCCCK